MDENWFVKKSFWSKLRNAYLKDANFKKFWKKINKEKFDKDLQELSFVPDEINENSIIRTGGIITDIQNRFDKNGNKLSDEIELEIERLMTMRLEEELIEPEKIEDIRNSLVDFCEKKNSWDRKANFAKNKIDWSLAGLFIWFAGRVVRLVETCLSIGKHILLQVGKRVQQIMSI